MKKTLILAALAMTALILLFTHDENAIPIVKIYIDEKYLNDTHIGILHSENRFNRGREWERPAILSYYERGTKLFDAKVGARIHGGKSRSTDDPSIRVYFRKRYQIEQVKKSNIFPGIKGDIEALVVHRANDFSNFIAMPIAEDMGANIPKMIPVKFYLNNAYHGVYFICEPLKKTYFSKQLGITENDLIYTRMKTHGDQSQEEKEDNQALVNYKKMLLKNDTLSLADVSRTLDINNYMSHTLSIVFMGTTDWRQGSIYKLKNGADKWKFINWDMEQSIWDHLARTRPDLITEDRPLWGQEGFELLTLGFNWKTPTGYIDIGMEKYDVRSLIFYRLWMEDPHFRDTYYAFAKSMFDTTITKNYLKKRIKELKSLAKSFSKNPKMIRMSEAFFPCRAGFIMNQLTMMKALPISHSSAQTIAQKGLLIDLLEKSHNYKCTDD